MAGRFGLLGCSEAAADRSAKNARPSCPFQLLPDLSLHLLGLISRYRARSIVLARQIRYSRSTGVAHALIDASWTEVRRACFASS
jgi:hypothetical protein